MKTSHVETRNAASVPTLLASAALATVLFGCSSGGGDGQAPGGNGGVGPGTAAWQPLPDAQGVQGGDVETLLVAEEDGVRVLYVAGTFTQATGQPATRVARVDVGTWSALGEGFDGQVSALAWFDDGSGPALYAGGSFQNSGDTPLARVARFDGRDWQPVGGGFDSAVEVLHVHDDGFGPALYAGGSFGTADGLAAARIARWDGVSWTAVGGGVSFTVGVTEPDGSFIQVLESFDHGFGPRLYAAGAFGQAGGQAAQWIARWDGVEWQALPGSLSGGVYAMAVHDEGSGPALYLGGFFRRVDFPEDPSIDLERVARFDGTTWSPLGQGVDNGVFALASAIFDGEPELIAGGEFREAGGDEANYIARWSAGEWRGLRDGVNDYVNALVVYDDGALLDGEPAVIAAGLFDQADGSRADRIARWNGLDWSTVGQELDDTPLAAASGLLGGEPVLVLGGLLQRAGGHLTRHVAAFDGTDFADLGGGLDRAARALVFFDDGSGEALFATGSFEAAGGSPAAKVASFDGAAWSPLGLGLGAAGSGGHALLVFDDGEGAALYVGGSFAEAGGLAAANIARWDGSDWSPLGAGTNGRVEALAVFDDGEGAALYAGGEFSQAGGQAASAIARWNGAAWSPLGSGAAGGVVRALEPFGAELVAGGTFSQMGGISAPLVARWNGSQWSGLGDGLIGSVRDLAVFDDGAGDALFATGFLFDQEPGGSLSEVHLWRWDGAQWNVPDGGLPDFGSGLAVHDDGGGEALWVVGWWREPGPSGPRHLAKWGPDPLLPSAAFATERAADPAAWEPAAGSARRQVPLPAGP